MIRRVEQLHDTGCFVACLAMLLDTTYQQAFQLVYPNRPMPAPWDRLERVWLDPEQALNMMPKFGIHPIRASIRSVRSLKKRTSLVLLRWRTQPSLQHALIFDGETGNFVDPSFKTSLNHKVMNRNLEAIYYIKKKLPMNFRYEVSTPHGTQVLVDCPSEQARQAGPDPVDIDAIDDNLDVDPK